MYALPLYNNFNTVSPFQTDDVFLQLLLKKNEKRDKLSSSPSFYAYILFESL